jgi:LPXTG-motif cell wall-anchored protein
VEQLAIMKIVAGVLILMASAGFALAGIGAAPEIDPTAAVGALALLGGGALVIRGRRRKQ